MQVRPVFSPRQIINGETGENLWYNPVLRLFDTMLRELE